MSKIRIGIVGGGGIANAHLPQLRKRSDAVALSGLADVNPAAGETAKKYEISRFVSDYGELIPHVDAAVICVPTHLHSKIACDFLRAGKHVFCEKPMARTMEQASAMARAAEEGRANLQIGFVRRFDTGWIGWRDALLAEKIGRPIVWRDFASSPGQAAPWFTIDEQGGGPFLDGCIHNYDFALFTFGPIEWAFAHLRKIHPKSTAFDTGTATLRFESGDELVLAWSWGLPPGSGWYREMDLLGPKGRMSWMKDETKILIDRGGENEHLTYAGDSLTRAFEHQMDEFIEVTRGKTKPRAGIAQGIESLRVALAVLESAQRGGEKIYLAEQS